MHWSGHLIAKFGNQVTIATFGKMATDYRLVFVKLPAKLILRKLWLLR